MPAVSICGPTSVGPAFRADNARVSETVLPETDDDSVRIMTIHGSKGLEFPITVLAGMTTKIQKADRGVDLLPTRQRPGIALVVGRHLQGIQHLEIHRRPDERTRTPPTPLRRRHTSTRSPDRLAASHRVDASTGASVMAGPANECGVSTPFVPTIASRPALRPPEPVAIPDRDTWLTERSDALKRASAGPSSPPPPSPGRQPRPRIPVSTSSRDLDLPPWQKGRYGTAVGRPCTACSRSSGSPTVPA